MSFEQQRQDIEDTVQDFLADAVFWLLIVSALLLAATAGTALHKKEMPIEEFVVWVGIALSMVGFSRKVSNFVFWVGYAEDPNIPDPEEDLTE